MGLRTPWLSRSKSFTKASGVETMTLFTRRLPNSLGRRFFSQAFHCRRFHETLSCASSTCFLWKSDQFGILWILGIEDFGIGILKNEKIKIAPQSKDTSRQFECVRPTNFVKKFSFSIEILEKIVFCENERVDCFFTRTNFLRHSHDSAIR